MLVEEEGAPVDMLSEAAAEDIGGIGNGTGLIDRCPRLFTAVRMTEVAVRIDDLHALPGDRGTAERGHRTLKR